MILVNVMYTLVYVCASMENYPGGAALTRFNNYYKNIDNGVPPLSSTQATR